VSIVIVIVVFGLSGEGFAHLVPEDHARADAFIEPILILTAKANALGNRRLCIICGTNHVWFYDIKADGWSVHAKRQPLLIDDKLSLQHFQNLSSLLLETNYEKTDLIC
jgi:hypothetical protein